MAEYKALRPCRFAGKSYLPNNVIDNGAIPQKSVQALLKMGLIAVAEKKHDVDIKAKAKAVQNSKPAPVSIKSQKAKKAEE